MNYKTIVELQNMFNFNCTVCMYCYKQGELVACCVLVYKEVYTTFTPHFKGKRRYISGIIALLSVLRNALTRIGGSI